MNELHVRQKQSDGLCFFEVKSRKRIPRPPLAMMKVVQMGNIFYSSM